MKEKIFILFLIGTLVGGCVQPLPALPQPPTRVAVNQWQAGDVTRFIDSEAGVVCWVYAGGDSSTRAVRGGISCLPVSQTKLGEKK